MQDDDIDRLLAMAAERKLVPSAALIEQVSADALALQPAPSAFRPASKPAPKARAFSGFVAAIGGLPAFAGLCSAAVVGGAIGYLNPATLDYLTGPSAETVELFPELDFLQAEG